MSATMCEFFLLPAPRDSCSSGSVTSADTLLCSSVPDVQLATASGSPPLLDGSADMSNVQ
jgi:hypothetical protein